jgi:hypothetical protein
MEEEPMFKIKNINTGKETMVDTYAEMKEKTDKLKEKGFSVVVFDKCGNRLYDIKECK